MNGLPKEFQAVDFHGETANARIDNHPDHCPYCRDKITPKFQAAFLDGDGLKGKYLQVVYQCPSRSCGRAFFGFFESRYPERNGDNSIYWLSFCAPGSPPPLNLPDSLKAVSPTFCKVMEEASEAEHHGLGLIAGPGYRKALEFLIKDFLIQYEKLPKDTIEKKYLGDCIRDHIEDPQTKKSAARAAWLGNDESHYTRVWAGQDITDLKKLLHVAWNAIDSRLVADGYEEKMPPGGKDQHKSR